MLDLTNTQATATTTQAVPPSKPPAKPPVRDRDLVGFQPERPGPAQGVIGLIGLATIAVAVLVAWEKFAPEDWRPSHLLGGLAGTVVSAEKTASMQAAAKELQLMSLEKARLDIEVKDAETRLAMTAKGFETQLDMQRQAYEAQVQRVTEAYKSLYERGNMVAGTTAQLASSLIQQRVALAQGHQGGKVISSVLGDLMAAWGQVSNNDELVENGRRMSNDATRSSINAVDAVISQPLPNFRPELWAGSNPDPAQLLAEVERMKPPVPSTTPMPPQRAVKPPTPYAAIDKEK